MTAAAIVPATRTLPPATRGEETRELPGDFQLVPQDVFQRHILPHLEPQDVAPLRLVHSRLKEAVDSAEGYWKEIAARIIPGSITGLPIPATPEGYRITAIHTARQIRDIWGVTTTRPPSFAEIDALHHPTNPLPADLPLRERIGFNLLRHNNRYNLLLKSIITCVMSTLFSLPFVPLTRYSKENEEFAHPELIIGTLLLYTAARLLLTPVKQQKWKELILSRLPLLICMASRAQLFSFLSTTPPGVEEVALRAIFTQKTPLERYGFLWIAIFSIIVFDIAYLADITADRSRMRVANALIR
jgi:hypothetical protein